MVVVAIVVTTTIIYKMMCFMSIEKIGALLKGA